MIVALLGSIDGSLKAHRTSRRR